MIADNFKGMKLPGNINQQLISPITLKCMAEDISQLNKPGILRHTQKMIRQILQVMVQQEALTGFLPRR